MVEWLASIRADALAFRGAAGEHERSTRVCMAGEPGEHPTLIIRFEMKEAVPGQQAVEPALQLELSHVPNQPLGSGKTGPAQPNHRWRRVDTNHTIADIYSVPADGLAHYPAHIQDLSAW